MYTYKPRTIAEIKADIRDLLHANDEDRAATQDDLASLYEELDEAEAALPVRDKYTTTGLDLIRVIQAFGGIPKEWEE